MGIVGNCEFAIQEAVRPEPKVTKSTLMRNILRLGDTEVHGTDDEALEITVMVSKCTAQARPKTWKRFVKREEDREEEDSHRMDVDESQAGGAAKAQYAELLMRSEYYVNRTEDADDEAPLRRSADRDNEDKDAGKGGDEEPAEPVLEKVEREELIRGFKYGTTFVPCPDGQFPRQQTRKGIDVCGFVKEKFVRLSFFDYFLFVKPLSFTDL
jgi:ATP-dependent DNA helicase 2 subunit 2